MNCNYCNKEIQKAVKCGPGINFCSEKCAVFSSFKRYPGSTLVKVYKLWYPAWYQEFRLRDSKLSKENIEQISLGDGFSTRCLKKVGG